MSYYNPYYNQNLIGFFKTLFQRVFTFATGQLSIVDLVSDEIQLLVLMGIAISAALVGSFLVLKRMTMMANSLSHTVLLGIVAAFLLARSNAGQEELSPHALNIGHLLIASFATAIVTTFLTTFLTRAAKLQEEASTGIVFTSFFSLGVLLLTLLTRNAHIGTEVIMGNADALHIDDCKLIFSIVAMNLFLFFLFFKEQAIVSFDPLFSRSLGISTTFFNYLLMIQTSATAIGAFRAVGIVVVLAMLTGPTLTARLFTHCLKSLLGLSALIGSCAALLGVALSRYFLTVYDMPLSTGGIVACVISLFYGIAIVVRVVLSQQLWVSEILEEKS